jgi:DNA-binding NtrC family response regulator
MRLSSLIPHPSSLSSGGPVMSKHPILLVDDEPEILFSLRGLLRQEFELYTAESGAEALEVLHRRPVHVIMTDQRMPQMTGVELLRRSQGECPEAIRLIFTGYADIKAVVDAINQGQVYRYLTKPWDPDELVAVLHEACEHYERIAERRRLLHDVRTYVARCQALLAGDGPAAEAARDGAALMERLDRALAAGPGTGGP